MPERIQQRRTKGWRKPENTVSVARPSKWGNPFRIGYADPVTGEVIPDAEVAVERFALHIGPMGSFELDLAEVRRELGGKNLMCFCPLDQPCHADVLLELANEDHHA